MSSGTKGVPRAERERQIASAAVGEFADHGYAGASMISIAARAGISKPLVYQYFGSKDALYLACLHDVAGALLARLQAAQVAEDDSVASRVRTLQAVFEAHEPQREAWRLLYDATVPPGSEIATAASGYRDGTAALAARGSSRFLTARGDDDERDAAALGAVWMGLVSSLVEWWLANPDESAAAMTQRCERLMAAVLG